jgi:hypothetical protein
VVVVGGGRAAVVVGGGASVVVVGGGASVVVGVTGLEVVGTVTGPPPPPWREPPGLRLRRVLVFFCLPGSAGNVVVVTWPEGSVVVTIAAAVFVSFALPFFLPVVVVATPPPAGSTAPA